MTQSSAVIPINFNPTVYEALESADNVIFFQWDLTADTFKLRDASSRHRYALPNHFNYASTQLTLGGLVHPDDAGMLEIEGSKVSFVEAISKRNRYAKQAILFVEMEGKIRKQGEEDE